MLYFWIELFLILLHSTDSRHKYPDENNSCTLHVYWGGFLLYQLLPSHIYRRRGEKRIHDSGTYLSYMLYNWPTLLYYMYCHFISCVCFRVRVFCLPSCTSAQLSSSLWWFIKNQPSSSSRNTRVCIFWPSASYRPKSPIN